MLSVLRGARHNWGSVLPNYELFQLSCFLRFWYYVLILTAMHAFFAKLLGKFWYFTRWPPISSKTITFDCLECKLQRGNAEKVDNLVSFLIIFAMFLQTEKYEARGVLKLFLVLNHFEDALLINKIACIKVQYFKYCTLILYSWLNTVQFARV